MEILRIIARIFVGLVFIFSSFVKSVDPLGSAYKFTDYFISAGFDFLSPLALPLAVLLSSLELILGTALLLGYRTRIAAWTALLFMAFFS